MSDHDKVMPPGLLAEAVPGNKLGVSIAYGYAAACLRQGEAPPPELCAWLADRLDDLQRALWAEDDRPDQAVMVAIGARRQPTGASKQAKRGRKASGEYERDRDRHLVWAIEAAQRNNPGMLLETIYPAVVEGWPTPHGRAEVTEAMARNAWKRRRVLIPE